MKSIKQYKHEDKERLNNPQIGLVNDRTDKSYGQEKKKYAYDPHLDPELGWDNNAAKAKLNLTFEYLKEAFKAQQQEIETLKKSLGEEKSELLENLKAQQNNIIALMKAAETAFQPALKWTGKAERTSFDVETLSLHVHERIDPNKIIETVAKEKNEGEQLDMFATEKRPLREALNFYKHKNNWANRLIAGDSLLVMNSLIEKESMEGKVQMIYFDPPYGIKYGSNFQPFTHKRSVTDGKDEDLTQEPEMIKAFRDTWELGIHSYLTYMRDRLLLAQKLLAEEGSIFVQISDENVHHVREILDEVFGKENFVSQITFRRKTGVLTAKYIGSVSDYIIWYAKDANNVVVNKLFEETIIEGDNIWSWVELQNGERRKMSRDEIFNHKLLPKNSKVFRLRALSPAGFNPNAAFKVEYKGQISNQPRRSQGASWAVNKEGVLELIKQRRVMPTKGQTLDFIYYFDDFPVSEITNLWSNSRGASNKIYVVQTDELSIQRCLLMTTSPGDLVMDITCGSGTTAAVAEQWGRRWITCDTSRIALTLAKQRLMTTVFDYYELAQPESGVGGGFKYKTVPHISVGQIANKQAYGEETLYDQPLINTKIKRVSVPFTVEAIPAPLVKSFGTETKGGSLDNNIGREGETYRQRQWQEELARTGIRAKGGKILQLQQLETLSGTRYLQAKGQTVEELPKSVLVTFGPEHSAMDARQVELAIEEARFLKPDILLFCAFQFDEEAAKDIDETSEEMLGFKLLKAQMNMDLQTDDLKRKNVSNQSFWLVGQPDVVVHELDEGKLQVEVKGFDYYNPLTGVVDSGSAKKIAMWLLDTDYDGRSLCPNQVFFPMAGAKEGWAKLAKTLNAEIDEDKIEAFRGTKSLPFELGKNKMVAVKIIDDRGIESLKVIRY